MTYDWPSLDPRQFVEFVADLLECSGFLNVTITEGAGDRGCDVVAIEEYRDPLSSNRVTTRHWAIQCKHRPNRSLSKNDLRDELDWLGVNPEIDCFRIVTTGRFTREFQSFVELHNDNHHRPQISLIDRLELEKLIPQHGDLQTAPPKGLSSDFVQDAAIATLGQDLVTSEQLDAIRQRLAILESNDGISLCLEESHECRYHADGQTRTNLHVVLANVGHQPLTSELFTIYGDLPVFDNVALDLDVSGIADPTQLKIISDDSRAKRLSVGFADAGLAPGETGEYRLEYSWPLNVASPLGVRFYHATAVRYVHRLSIIQLVPKPFTVDHSSVRRNSSDNSVTDSLDRLVTSVERERGWSGVQLTISPHRIGQPIQFYAVIGEDI